MCWYLKALIHCGLHIVSFELQPFCHKHTSPHNLDVEKICDPDRFELFSDVLTQEAQEKRYDLLFFINGLAFLVASLTMFLQ